MKQPKHVSPFHGPVTASFLKEAETYRFHYQCQQCVFFDESTHGCVHGYPNEHHLEEYFDEDAVGKVLVFCRDFELGEH